MKKIISSIIFFSLLLSSNLSAQDESESKILRWSYLQGLEYRLKAGFNIGGTTPLPLPAEIREINSYDPTLQIAIEGDVVKWLDKKWGLLLGIRLENKGMKTDANVKNYGMKMIAADGGMMEGYWTGNVVTQVQNSYLTIPVCAVLKITPRWEIKAGAFASYLIKGDFSGHVYDGYIRKGDPTGIKVVFEDDAIATYDFSNDLRYFQCGPEIGAKWRAYKHLSLYADLTWGMVPIFKKDFKTITFDMFPVYANIGFEYKF
ncbi:MAG: porin family protein [Bacteroidales bacterium]|nr:porin family protein [Bacteroidales bacterium]